jgi:hypothetical protein
MPSLTSVSGMNQERSKNFLEWSHGLLMMSTLPWVLSGIGWLLGDLIPPIGAICIFAALFSLVTCPLALLTGTLAVGFDVRSRMAWITVLLALLATAASLTICDLVFHGLGAGVD